MDEKAMPPTDYWNDRSISDWRRHVVGSLEVSRDLIPDWDGTYRLAITNLSELYISWCGIRSAEQPEPRSERELEDVFWELQRSSTVIDALVGSACVILMRWIDYVARIFGNELVLLNTPFPFVTKPAKEAISQSNRRAIMRDFGPKVDGKDLSCATAIWQMGNVFKHGNDRELRKPTREAAAILGFGSQTLGIKESENEALLRSFARDRVGYTLGSDSIERMALQLGCSPEAGLVPLYGLTRDWQESIEKRLHREQDALRKLL